MNRFVALLLWSSFVLLGQAQHHTDWSRGAVMYEVNVRQYSNAGTFRAFSRHLDRLDAMGVDILWFMPIHPIGEVHRKGSLGSYYAVRDYMDVNPEFGTLEDFRNLVGEAHARGMKIMLDWVANHSAPDNPLASAHPSWYVRDASGRFLPPAGTDWTDVIQFNHASLDLLHWMQDAMAFWLEDVGVDGFRFDAASFVPDAFWVPLLSHLKSIRPDVFLLAESDGRRYHDAGFHMTFAWDLYGFGGGLLADVSAGRAGATDLWNYLVDDRNRYPGDDYRLYFTSNHDENSWIGTVQERFGDARAAFYILSATMNDMPLMYSGQEVDNDRRLAFFEKDAIVWVDEHPMMDLFTVLNRLKEEESALWSGTAGADPVRMSVSQPEEVLAFSRANEESRVAVMANLSPEMQTFTVASGLWDGTWMDALTGEVVLLPDQMQLQGWEARVFVEPAASTGTDRRGRGPGRTGLVHAYPNPSSGGTVLAVQEGPSGFVDWEVRDVLGRRVDRGRLPAGKTAVRLEDASWPAGVYFYRVSAGDTWFHGSFVRR